jgi:hypothetical protein
MNKIIMFIMSGLIASSVFADIQSFQWVGGDPTDPINLGSDYVITLVDDDTAIDLWGDVYDVSGVNTIGESTVQAYQSVQIASGLSGTLPFGPNAGKWQTVAVNSTDDSLVGKYPYVVVSDKSDMQDIVNGDTFWLADGVGPVIVAGASPPAVPVTVAPGSISSVTVVPEPATIGLFGLGALGAWIIRRRKWQS